jgi:CRP-like cAMP-binding protein
VTQTTRDGQQVVVRYVGPGEFMGIAAVTAGAIYPATATAVVDSVVLSWSTAAIAAVIARHPQIAVSALGGVGGRLNEAHARLREMSTERVERRIAHALVRLVRQSGARTDEGIEIAFPISRQDIAEMTGTTLHTVSRTLAAWEGDGILAGGRQKIVIRDPHRLVTIAEDLPVAERQAHSPRADRRRA